MIRNTGMALAFVIAAALELNRETKGAKAPWMARTVADRVTHTKIGTVRENDVNVNASFHTRKHIERVCEVRV